MKMSGLMNHKGLFYCTNMKYFRQHSATITMEMNKFFKFGRGLKLKQKLGVKFSNFFNKRKIVATFRGIKMFIEFSINPQEVTQINQSLCHVEL